MKHPVYDGLEGKRFIPRFKKKTINCQLLLSKVGRNVVSYDSNLRLL